MYDEWEVTTLPQGNAEACLRVSSSYNRAELKEPITRLHYQTQIPLLLYIF
ncbi:unnamed protein product [Penicillium roqueforti FM164]|uniref:Genomic scaffold, ProqFM164S04 n=1 Tax=Penicillium roqueforti (strain FM164) TaxID=1365484 RepID=W6QPF0_PENRF|nr:unnamed protein product [Penicillium roqueforti FM164]